jgi:hypothetical protein
MKIRVYRNQPKSSPTRKSWGWSKVSTMNCIWVGPIFILLWWR